MHVCDWFGCCPLAPVERTLFIEPTGLKNSGVDVADRLKITVQCCVPEYGVGLGPLTCTADSYTAPDASGSDTDVCKRYVGSNNDEGCFSGFGKKGQGTIVTKSFTDACMTCAEHGLQLCKRKCSGQGCH